MTDVWFVADKNQNANAAASISVATPVTTAALSTAQIAALAPTQAGALTAAVGLQSQVGGLAQAIGSFTQSQSSSGALGMPVIDALPNAALLAIPVLGVAANVAGMVGALQQFDPNGNLAGAFAINNGVEVGTALTTSVLSNPANNGTLAIGKPGG
jgi:hypothetical protein